MTDTSDKPTILLVDDEEDIREVLRMSLTDMGYEVVLAKDGQEALRRFDETRPAIVMTDIKMPVVDGIEVLKRIKRIDPETEVIMITGHGDMKLAIESLKNEATDFITKPIHIDALEISLKRARDRILVRQQLKDYTAGLEALVREKIELQDHLSSLGLMLGSISHGIKGLLTGLDGGIYLVEAGFRHQDLDQVREGWAAVKQVIERIRRMIADILFYAKKRELRWERIDALAFAEEVAAGFEPKAEAHGIVFERRFDPAGATLNIDPGYIHSALANILENAIDACLRDESKSEHRIVFGLQADGDDVVFSVHDNGIGMNAETREKLFTLFFTSKGRKGTGLGLFVANQIVDQHGGTINVDSAPGRGSRFVVRIPRADGPAAGAGG
ncbi:MAG TPA: hybrid sensor histidine kinase/response regulator [Desulfobacteraceae bacterium]|nr:hybrid sensor histidine kinase/response regulator [Deltaproteobacteria bacterium]MBW2356111.1 hybrid sensor histidine kinase/response regulator [Deltaproteobacteria bacterium]RKZ83450.1 MAG: response regulator [Gammaproteobacteria bacterium]RLB98661.1 MAG: response regulator [Deltaproteobacteria bacterium]HDI61232.1 hybrid sensor histidine kinase/response regulator [Desulfobacteraceae bacterium]